MKKIPGKGMAEFMRLRGRRVVQMAGAYWHSVEWGLYVSLPCQCRLNPSPEEIDEMLRSTRALGVRFPTDSWTGTPGGLYVCRNKNYDIGAVNRRYRSRVRRGLRQCDIHPVEAGQLRAEGLRINRETMERQGRFDPEFGKPKRWERLVEAVRLVPAIEAVGAFRHGRLVAYAITYREHGWLHVLHQMSLNSERDRYTNHVLDYQITRWAALDPEIEAVSLGWVSLLGKPGLHQYKLHLGYEVEPHREAFRLHPALALVLENRLALRAVDALRRLRPADQRLIKLAHVVQGARLSGRRGYVTRWSSARGGLA